MPKTLIVSYTLSVWIVQYANYISIKLLFFKKKILSHSPSVTFSNTQPLLLVINGHVVPCGGCCSVTKLILTLCNPMDCSTPGFPVLHYVPEFAQTHVYWVGDAIQPSHPLLPAFPPALNLSHHQGLFQWIGSSNQMAKVLELQLQHQSFQWIFRVDFL